MSYKKYSIVLKSSARKEFLALDGRLKKSVLKKFDLLAVSPECGKPLGHKGGHNLTNIRSIRFDKSRMRIVYHIHKNEIKIIIISIGKREAEAAYLSAIIRLNNKISP